VDGGGKGINVDDGTHKLISRNNVVAAGFHKMKGDSVHATGNLIVHPILNSCVYFSHFNRIPANLTFTSNICITKLPAYGFGVAGGALLGVCYNKASFSADYNYFFTSAKNDKLEFCAKSWATWTGTLQQDQHSYYSHSTPSTDQVISWMQAILSWLPK